MAIEPKNYQKFSALKMVYAPTAKPKRALNFSILSSRIVNSSLGKYLAIKAMLVRNLFNKSQLISIPF